MGTGTVVKFDTQVGRMRIEGLTAPRVICPRCGARADSPCVTASGKLARIPHAPRMAVVRTPGALEDTLRASVEEAYWLTPLYGPTIDAALIIARKVDDQVWAAETKTAGTLFDGHALGDLEGGIVYDLQTLLTLLTALGLTPRGRAELNLPDQDGADDLASILEIYGS
jgi:hypothetical protein